MPVDRTPPKSRGGNNKFRQPSPSPTEQKSLKKHDTKEAMGEYDTQLVNLDAATKDLGRSSVHQKELAEGFSLKVEQMSNSLHFQTPPTCQICLNGPRCQIVHSRTKRMGTLINQRKPRAAESIFDGLVEEGHKPSLVTYTSLLTALTIQKKFDSIPSVRSQVEDDGLKPDSIYFNALINAFSEAGKPEESQKLVDMMTSEGDARPNQKTYNVLINAWCDQKNLGEAWNVVYKMCASGIRPDIVSYNTIAGAYADAGETKRTVDLVLEMEHEPLAIIVRGYCKEGIMEHALRCLRVMKGRGVLPNVICFNTLLVLFHFPLGSFSPTLENHKCVYLNI